MVIDPVKDTLIEFFGVISTTLEHYYARLVQISSPGGVFEFERDSACALLLYQRASIFRALIFLCSRQRVDSQWKWSFLFFTRPQHPHFILILCTSFRDVQQVYHTPTRALDAYAVSVSALYGLVCHWVLVGYRPLFTFTPFHYQKIPQNR